MILDSGLDHACTLPANSNTTFENAIFTRFITYACFGTGSTAPSAGDTSLGAQVGSRSNNAGGFGGARNGGLDAGNKVIWAETTFTRVFTIASNVNAAEWGLAPAATGNLTVRELFRSDPQDDSSSPIVLTLESGDELQLVVTVRVQAAWEYVASNFVITGTAGNDAAGTHDVNSAIATGSQTTQAYIDLALASAWPGGAFSSGTYTHGFLTYISANPAAVPVNGNLTLVTNSNQAFAAASYTNSTFYRDCTVVIPTSEYNGTHYGWLARTIYAGLSTQDQCGLRALLTDPTTLAKAATHKLTLTVRKSIARL